MEGREGREDKDKKEAGAFAGVTRTEDPRVEPRNDDSCAFLAEMRSGAQGIFHTSWLAYQGAECQHQELEVYGTGGRLHFVANHAGTFLRGKRVGERSGETFPSRASSARKGARRTKIISVRGG